MLQPFPETAETVDDPETSESPLVEEGAGVGQTSGEELRAGSPVEDDGGDRHDPAPTVMCEDGVLRPTWAVRSSAARAYFDTEWGTPRVDEEGLLELVVLLGFAAGLTWASVLARREALAVFFRDYDAEAVAAFTDADVERGLADPGLIRNRRKIEAAVTNARAAVAVREIGGLAALVWGDASRGVGGGAVGVPSPVTEVDLADVPRADGSSEALAATLRQSGFVRMGPVSAQALRLACGAVRVRRE